MVVAKYNDHYVLSCYILQKGLSSEELRAKILELFSEDKMVLKREGHYGKQYEQIMKITEPNGKTANVLTAWIKEDEASEPRLTSLYVTEKEAK